MRDIQVNTGTVRETGDDMSAPFRDVRRRLEHALDSGATVSPGWQSSDALGRCATAWQDHPAMPALARTARHTTPPWAPR